LVYRTALNTAQKAGYCLLLLKVAETAQRKYYEAILKDKGIIMPWQRDLT
jgi:hypothetical protein